MSRLPDCPLKLLSWLLIEFILLLSLKLSLLNEFDGIIAEWLSLLVLSSFAKLGVPGLLFDPSSSLL
jgi:hypothetical protein